METSSSHATQTLGPNLVPPYIQERFIGMKCTYSFTNLFKIDYFERENGKAIHGMPLLNGHWISLMVVSDILVCQLKETLGMDVTMWFPMR